MVMRAFDYTAYPGTNPYVTPKIADKPTGGGAPANSPLIGAGVALDDARHQANFMQLWREANPAVAYDYLSKSPSAINWFQRNQDWIKNTLFGGNDASYNSWKNDASYAIRNVYSQSPHLEDQVMNMVSGKSFGVPWKPGDPTGFWRPSWDNPYGNDYNEQFGSPYLGGKPDTNTISSYGKSPVGDSVAAPALWGSTVPTNNSVGPAQYSPQTTVPTKSAISGNPYQVGYRNPNNTYSGSTGAGGWNPYRGWNQ